MENVFQKREDFYRKEYAENVLPKLFPDSFLILVNKAKQSTQARKFFENKVILKEDYLKTLKN